jgi:hypothetical protein
MPFWMVVLILVTLIALCWGSGYGWYRGNPPGGPWGPGLLGLLGLIMFIVLVMLFVGGDRMLGAGVIPR